MEICYTIYMFKKKEWTDQLNLTYLLIAVIIGVAILGYGWMNNETKQAELGIKRDQMAQEEEEKASKAREYTLCESEAKRNADSWWERSCESKKLGEDCRLPLVEGDVIRQSQKEALDRCVQLYK